MKSLNRVQLIGWLGKDPDIIIKKDGARMALLRLATDVFISQEGNKPKKVTTWHDVVIWKDRLVEHAKTYLLKGSHVLVDGSISYYTFPDHLGHVRYMTEIRVNYLVDLDR
jgi:single-strand DNA-binding protein